MPPDTAMRRKQVPGGQFVSSLRFATSAHLRAAGRRILGGIGRQSRFVAAAGVAEVLARGPIRGGLQARLAVARVGEQPTAFDGRVAAESDGGCRVKVFRPWPSGPFLHAAEFH